MLLVLAWVALVCAAVPAVLFLWNLFLFREPPKIPSLTLPARKVESISVLIPARNEEASIAACVESALASCEVEIEIIVLDDHSDDRTAEIVREIARKDSRVRLESAPPLPEGWCGKQHACFVLSTLARNPILTFLDADVRLGPDALARMAAFLHETRAGLVSGFPRQETGTLLEKLVIPLINWLLMCYLPMIGMRKTRLPGFAVGCGQWFMTGREAYDAIGGHAAVKSSLHDGLTLPRAYRRAAFHTDICDATNLAVCRMYRSARGVWFGLAKNAREGMAATAQIGIWTLALFCGHVLPFLLLATALGLIATGTAIADDPFEQMLEKATQPYLILLTAKACIYSLIPRLKCTWDFRQSWFGAMLHPLGVLALLAIQWYAVYRSITGRPVEWKGRESPRLAPAS